MDAIAPRLLTPADGVDRHPAEFLAGAVFGNIAFNPNSGYYHRYWFGIIPTTSFLLYIFDVRQARLLLMNTSYFLFMLIPALAALISRRMLTVMSFVSAFGILFSSLPYHGEAIGYAPAFIWSQTALVITLLLWRHVADNRLLIVLNLVLGAVAAYVEPMSGAFVMAAALLFLANFFLLPAALPRARAFQRATCAVALFFAGFLLSVLFKQTLVFAIFGWQDTFGAFFHQLEWRMGMTGEKITILREFRELMGNTVYLTFGSELLAKLLRWGSLGALLCGTALAAVDLLIQRNRAGAWRERLIEYAAIVTVVVMIATWFIVLPSHNYIHAWITVRLLYIPFGMSALLFCWSVRNLYRDLSPVPLASGWDPSAIDPPANQAVATNGARQAMYSAQYLQEALAVLSRTDPAVCESVVRNFRKRSIGTK
jgi:hypothetical protein